MSPVRLYWVRFDEPAHPLRDLLVEPGTDFFFTSLAAIYDLFTPEQVGCRLAALWALGVSRGAVYSGRGCIISSYPLRGKRQAAHKSKL